MLVKYAGVRSVSDSELLPSTAFGRSGIGTPVTEASGMKRPILLCLVAALMTPKTSAAHDAPNRCGHQLVGSKCAGITSDVRRPPSCETVDAQVHHKSKLSAAANKDQRKAWILGVDAETFPILTLE